MSKFSRLRRIGVLVVTGGCLLQVAGCVSGLTPVLLSVLESVAFNAITGALLGP
ncbi:MAG: hypothetical protein JSU63_11795 [Phycisphaerales bacterium]|nr:MAG: hypothetical protein JSU63_11795 [Phycisphaerales bacterium]